MFPCCCLQASCADLCLTITLQDVDYSLDFSEAPTPNERGAGTLNDYLVDHALEQPWHVPYYGQNYTGLGLEWPDDHTPGVPLTLTPHSCQCIWRRREVTSCPSNYYTHVVYTYQDEETEEWYLCLGISNDYYSYDADRFDVIYTKKLDAVYEDCPECEGEGCEECDDTGQVISEETRCWWKQGLTHVLDHTRTVYPYSEDPVPGTPDFSGSTATIIATRGTTTCDIQPILSWDNYQYRQAYCTTDLNNYLNFVQVEIAGIKSYPQRTNGPGVILDITHDAGPDNNEWRITVGHWPAYGHLTGRTSDSEGVIWGVDMGKVPQSPKTCRVYWWSQQPYQTEWDPDDPCSDPPNEAGEGRVGQRTGVLATGTPPYLSISGGSGDPLPAQQSAPLMSDKFLRIVPEGNDRTDPAYYTSSEYGFQAPQPSDWNNIQPDPDTEEWTFGVEVGDYVEHGQCLAWLPIEGTFLLDPPKTWYDHDCNEWIYLARHPAAPDRYFRVRALQEIRELSGDWEFGWSVWINWSRPHGADVEYYLSNYMWGWSASTCCCPEDLAITRLYSDVFGLSAADNWRFAAGEVSLTCFTVPVPPGEVCTLLEYGQLEAQLGNFTACTVNLIGPVDIESFATTTFSKDSPVLIGPPSGLGTCSTNLETCYAVWDTPPAESWIIPDKITLHTGDPGVDGTANQYSGGGYIAQYAYWNSESGGYRTLLTDVAFSGVNGNTVTHAGLWKRGFFSGDTFIDGVALQGDTEFGVNGLIMLKDATKYPTE